MNNFFDIKRTNQHFFFIFDFDIRSVFYLGGSAFPLETSAFNYGLYLKKQVSSPVLRQWLRTILPKFLSRFLFTLLSDKVETLYR
jgi:hypothetical protein